MQLEHVTLRDLTEFPDKRSCFESIRNQFINTQQRYIMPVRDFDWYMGQDCGNKLRRKVYYRVGSGARCGGYLWAVNKADKKPSEGMRFFTVNTSGHQRLPVWSLQSSLRM
jgi:hypothetical protein